MNYLLDTNIVIYLQKGWLAEPLPEGYMAISIITEIELRGFPGLSTVQENHLAAFLAEIRIDGLDYNVKEAAIRLRHNHRIKLPDALIAATALVNNAVLLTNDEYLYGLPELTCRKLKVLR